MRIRDVLESDKCRQIYEDVQKFTEQSLSEYNESLEKGFHYSDKDIFDFVWGTVNFSAAEMAILDSPLLQRLRHIRHLGLASTVYCNADSSRFSHTIGVTEVAGRMANVVTKKVKDVLDQNELEEYKKFDPEEVVRIAAIFHDTGHMFFSHVSELFFSRDKIFPKYAEVTQALSFFCEETSSETSLHELLSVMIVNSPAVINLFKLIFNNMKTHFDDDSDYEQLSEFISCLIIGVPTNKYILPYSMIINSAVDADKLDYLSRDSQCTKVPIAVDIARIIQKLDVVNIEKLNASNIWDDTTSNTVPYKVMALKNSAKNVFFQLSNARYSMYESVYYHHKVLTAETMFRKALQALYSAKNIKNINFCDILKLTDDSFNPYWEYALLTNEERKTCNIKEVSNLLKWIRERNLFKRVAAFSHDIIIAPKAAKEDFLNTIIQNPMSEDYRRFCDRLTEEYHSVCKILDIVANDTPNFMFIYSKYSAMSAVPVESGDGYCVWSSQLMKQDTIEAGKKAKQEKFYLVTDCQNRLPVFLALEKVVTEFGIKGLTHESHICSKLKRNILNQKRNILFNKNYYQGVLYILRDDFLTEKIYDKNLLALIDEKYRSFTGYQNCRVTPKSLLEYLRQFLRFDVDCNNFKLLINGILKILVEAHYIDRDVFAQQFSKLLNEQLLKVNGAHIYVVLLGGLLDSAYHWSYFINDVKEKQGVSLEGKVDTVLNRATNEDCICFFDDGAYSGKQVIGIFQELMGIPINKRATQEHHVDELSEDGKAKLKSIKIILSYLYFNKNSEKYILEELKKLGINNITICYNTDLSDKLFDKSNMFTGDDQKQVVEMYMRIAGQNILDSTKKTKDGDYKEHWNEERVRSSALGYNDAQQIVVFYNNIPTYSLTALWANGKVLGKDWKGLFQRTEKD